jgi:SagB-type dehydrogenase family enzyme
VNVRLVLELAPDIRSNARKKAASTFRTSAGKDLLDALKDGVSFSHAIAVLHELIRERAVCRSLKLGRRVLARAIPVGEAFNIATVERKSNTICRLSRFACLRRSQDRLIMESPRSQTMILFEDETLVPAVAALIKGTDAKRLGRILGNAELARAVIDLFSAADVLADKSEDRGDLRHWAFHDLLFHSRSRSGRQPDPYGALLSAKVRAVFKPSRRGSVVGLTMPIDPQWPSFQQILEERRSRRRHRSPAITASELGDFLFYCARATRVSRSAKGIVTAFRPYPSAGGAYELEVYIAVNRCGDLDPGLYYYRPLEHELELVSKSPDVQLLIRNAGKAADAAAPQLLLILAARFDRLGLRYGSIAYALTLKNVGVLIQTMYLVATAMGLAACAIGGGNSDLFARVAELDYYKEGSVGELILGRM